MPKSLAGVSIRRVQPHSHVIEMDTDVITGWEQWFLLRSDAHWDNAHADLELEARHLDQAAERGAGIIDIGDWFCAMQGKWDKRADQSQLRDEHRGNNYLNLLVDTAIERYARWAPWWLFASPGNHEGGILKRHGSCLTSSMVAGLRMHGSQAMQGTYAGWIRFRLNHNGTRRDSINLYYTHGYGGGGPVTRGVIQTNRMAVYLPDAEIVWSGHTHDSWWLAIERDRITPAGETFRDRQHHIKTPGYKEEYGSYDGWHTHRGGPPKPLGALWMRLSNGGKGKLEVDFVEAR